jgi:hypothetical protein
MMGYDDIKTTTIYLAASAEHLRAQMTKHPLSAGLLDGRIAGAASGHPAEKAWEREPYRENGAYPPSTGWFLPVSPRR